MTRRRISRSEPRAGQSLQRVGRGPGRAGGKRASIGNRLWHRQLHRAARRASDLGDRGRFEPGICRGGSPALGRRPAPQLPLPRRDRGRLGCGVRHDRSVGCARAHRGRRRISRRPLSRAAPGRDTDPEGYRRASGFTGRWTGRSATTGAIPKQAWAGRWARRLPRSRLPSFNWLGILGWWFTAGCSAARRRPRHRSG